MRYVAARTKRLEKRMVDHLAKLLWKVVNERFEGNATWFAEKAGVSQSAIAQILKPGGGDRGVGIVVLLALRDYLGNVTLDEMLGLPPPRLSTLPPAPPAPSIAPVAAVSDAKLQEAVEAALEAALERRLGPVAVPPTPPNGSRRAASRRKQPR